MEEEKQRRDDTSSKRRILQHISVPFLWEEKPGMPKKEWPAPPPPPEQDMLMLLPTRPPPPPPAAPAIPFKWEEKPGTPIRSFTRDPSLAPKNKSLLPLPPAYYSQFFECFDSEQESSYEDEDEDDDPDWLTELDASSSAPSLLANRLVPVSAISSAVPFDRSSSSYETGSTSPVGSSILEQLFPLYTPKANAQPRFHEVDERSVVFRRPQTLGDLIMLSQRRTYLQRPPGITKNGVSEGPSASGCFMFGSGNGGIAKLLGGKTLLSLKFV